MEHVPGRAAAEGFSPTSPRAHWIRPEQGSLSSEGSVMGILPDGSVMSMERV